MQCSFRVEGLLNELSQYTISHVHCKTNEVVNSFAKFGLNSSDKNHIFNILSNFPFSPR